MKKKGDEEDVERLAKAMFLSAVKSARKEFDEAGVGLDDATEFFLRLKSETDAALVVLSTSYIDAHLTDAWRRNMPGKSNTALDALFDNAGPLATMSSKIRLAHALNWITDELNADLHTLRKIRNKFAHDPYRQRLDDEKVVPLVRALKDTESDAIAVLREGDLDVPKPDPRLMFHARVAMICHQLAIQMRAGPIAIRNHVPQGAILGTYDDGSRVRKDLAVSQATILLKLLGLEVSSE